ncbi:hypothetical protein NUW58_g7366 [Xylaria curta]|uniref:Uncharacterized protein n=1 Tax=Xylaria curta TaxID=42375 RepID=A0ACC1NHR6_9PEZI|nr:hypothetical protein NUW58_g7366 [Xylaria curta]
MHSYAIEVWLQCIADYTEATTCSSLASLSLPNKRKVLGSISGNPASNRGGQDGGPFKVQGPKAIHAVDLNPNDDAPTLRTSRRRRTKASSEEAGFHQELPHRPGAARTGSPRKQKVNTPQDQDASLGNSDPNTERDLEYDVDHNAKSKLAAAISAPVPYQHPIATPPTSFSPPSVPESSAPTAKSGRSKSPVKTLADLAGASKPPILLPLEAGTLPEDAQNLYKKLLRISKGRNLIPAAVKDRFELASGPLEPWEIDVTTLSSINELEREIDLAQRICKKAHTLTRDGHAEPGWNCDVHSPILDLALDCFNRVEPINITTATLCPGLAPKLEVNSQTMQSKLVDYSINLVPDTNSPLAYAIDTFIASQSFEMRTITPTMYDPVRRRPQGIAIETKAPSSSSEPMVQLSVWAKATFTRFHQLLQSNPQAKTLRTPTLPFIAVRGHEWDLWFGHDKKDAFELYGPFSIGCTKSLVKTWMLITSLRALGEWVDEDFCIWLESAVGLQNQQEDC